MGWRERVTRVLDILLRPNLANPAGAGLPASATRDDAASVKTYRYLRLGMIVTVVALMASILYSRVVAGCWQGSISAYYYSPARPVFVSGMVAISLSLIVIKGSTVLEDMLLNFAGMLAPIVAFVPTSYEPACVPGRGLEPGSGGSLPGHIVADAQNNIAAVLIGGTFALVLGLVVSAIEHRSTDLSAPHLIGRGILFLVTSAAVAVGWIMLANDSILDYHGWAAVGMFGFLALASIANGLSLHRINGVAAVPTSRHWRALSCSYITVGVAMAVAGVTIKYLVPGPWGHRTLVLEIVEIGLFLVMWVIQSIERWGRVLER